jgi:hypothetical protein
MPGTTNPAAMRTLCFLQDILWCHLTLLYGVCMQSGRQASNQSTSQHALTCCVPGFACAWLYWGWVLVPGPVSDQRESFVSSDHLLHAGGV